MIRIMFMLSFVEHEISFDSDYYNIYNQFEFHAQLI